MRTSTLTDLILRILAAAALAVSGYIHAQLYVADYRYIHVVGVLFLVQASASFALAVLLLAGPPPLIRLAAAGAAAGALGGFLASRTVGVFGFTEHGWDPSPQSLLSVLVEVAVLLFLAPALAAMGGWAWSASRTRVRAVRA
ncbi:hypothetical protein GCM10009839_68460 [Catenulispora yoronensis]|uniref:Integral membrane protein n=1 Tax=Catenulispora yoronensis TaxID=450799 RepID=A0ABP5GRA5_9ACTN